MISVAREAACVRTTCAFVVDPRFLARKRTGPNSMPLGLKTKESKDPGTRFSLLSFYWLCSLWVYCSDDNGDAKSNFGFWVRKIGLGQGMLWIIEKMGGGECNKIAKRKKKRKHFEWKDILIPLEWVGKELLLCFFYVL